MRVLAAAFVVALSVSSALAVDVTTCAAPTVDDTPVAIPAGQTAVLQADLSGCHYAVALEDNATLQLNNHTISDCGTIAVVCLGRRCTIEGPGEITGGGCSIGHDTFGRVTRMTVRNLVMHDTWGSLGGARVILEAENVTVTGQLANPNSENQTNSIAVGGLRVAGTNLTITDNIGFGLYSYRRPQLTNSTLTGNNGFAGGNDFMSQRRPKFEGVTCGRSLRAAGGTWGVCTDD
jgi:hypothetical protein